MAPRLRSGITTVLVVSGAVTALALWPAREVAVRPDVRAVRTSARLRAQELAERWRVAEAERRIAEYRHQLTQALAFHAEHGGAALLVIAPDGPRDVMRARLTALLDTVWHSLGLGITKITVGVVVDLSDDAERGQATPRMDRGRTVHLLPDSSDRATCIALLSPTRGFAHMIQDASGPAQSRLEEWLMAGLGPCAFYAAYGAPGKAVRHWLGRRMFDLAQLPAVPQEPSEQRFLAFEPAARRWFYEWIYGFSPGAVACLGGRPEACRVAVLAGADVLDLNDAPPRFVVGQSRWRREQAVFWAGRYLGDVAREVGPHRFHRFWTTAEPVETGLETALQKPVGDWTEGWQRRFAPRLPLGPSIPVGAVLLGLGLAAGAIAAAAAAAQRRGVG